MRNKNMIIEGSFHGHLLVLLDLGVKNGKRRVLAECVNCSSGTREYSFDLLRRGETRSCGCLRKQFCSRLNMKHGMSSSRPYSIWANMIQRCTNKNRQDFEHYGGKNITFDDSWRNFEGFWEDMSESYSEDLELDRIDVEGNYSKENCRWVNSFVQAYNTGARVNNTSGKRGVKYNRARSKWEAFISFDSKEIYLGLYENFEDAVKVRKEAENKYYGYELDH